MSFKFVSPLLEWKRIQFLVGLIVAFWWIERWDSKKNYLHKVTFAINCVFINNAEEPLRGYFEGKLSLKFIALFVISLSYSKVNILFH